MIFDPALAAAARRHQRAKSKAEKSSATGGSPNTSSAENSSSVNNSSSSTHSNTASSTAVKVPESNLDGTPAAAAAWPETSEHGGRGNAKALGVGEKAGSNNGSVGDVGSTGTVSGVGTLSRTASASSNGVDFEGATARVRAGGGASRQRPMKPRVLLKIVVLGCSNVSYCVCVFSSCSAEAPASTTAVRLLYTAVFSSGEFAQEPFPLTSVRPIYSYEYVRVSYTRSTSYMVSYIHFPPDHTIDLLTPSAAEAMPHFLSATK